VSVEVSTSGERLVTQVRAEVEAHRPAGAVEVRSQRTTLRMLEWLVSPLDQAADPTHVTGSAIVVDQAGRLLLHRHKRLGIWLQPGGHLEPGEHPAAAAVRETREETGIAACHPDAGPRLLHVDVHEGPRGHVHLDLRYLLHADGASAFAPDPGESPDVAWWELATAAAQADRSLRAAIDLVAQL
jgi:8-oxo-dGTP pyrophosphatase MutT (NUDIX family)